MKTQAEPTNTGVASSRAEGIHTDLFSDAQHRAKKVQRDAAGGDCSDYPNDCDCECAPQCPDCDCN